MLRLLRMMRFRWDHRWTQKHLSEYLDDELDPIARRRVDRHLDLCPQCRRVLASLKRMLGGLAGLREPGRGPIAETIIARLRVEP